MNGKKMDPITYINTNFCPYLKEENKKTCLWLLHTFFCSGNREKLNSIQVLSRSRINNKKQHLKSLRGQKNLNDLKPINNVKTFA